MTLWTSGLATVVATAMAAGASSPLGRYADAARVLVIAAPSRDDAALRTQDRLLAAVRAGLSERDLVVVHVVGGEARDSRGARLDARAVRMAAGMASDRFGVVLIGKDGEVKLRRREALDPAELFSTIDAMPMRREEMRRKPGAPTA